MKSFAHFLVAAVIVSLVIMSPALGQQPIQEQLRSQCPQRDAIPALREELSRYNCSVDAVLIPDGYALVVTTNNTKHVAAVQKAINAFYSGSGDTKLSVSGGSCAAIKAAIVAGKVHHAIAKLSNGVLLTVTSRDDSLVKLIRETDCCNYCLCNNPTAQCYGSCCK